MPRARRRASGGARTCPLPVVPATRPWGPSRTRSTVSTPSSDTPIGAARSGSSPAAAQRVATAAALGSSRPSRGRRATIGGRPAPATSSSGSSKRARPRAARRAVASETPHARTSVSTTPSRTWWSVAGPSASATSTIVVTDAGSWSSVAATTMPATRPAPPRSTERAGARRPSVRRSSSTTTRVAGPASSARERAGAVLDLAGLGRLEQGAAQRLGPVGVGGDQATAGARGVERVGQPLGPVPVGRPVGRGQHHGGQVGGTVEGGGLHQQRPRHRQRRGSRADHPDHPTPVEVDQHRCAGDAGGPSHLVADLGGLGPAVAVDGRLPRLGADAGSEVEPVVVAGPPLPQSGAGRLDAPQQLGRVGRLVGPAGPLRRGQAGEGLAELAHLPGEAGSLLPSALATATAGVDRPADHHDRAEQQEQGERQLAGDRDHHAAEGQRGEDRHDADGRGAARCVRCGGRVDRVGRRRRGGPGRSVEGDRHPAPTGRGAAAGRAVVVGRRSHRELERSEAHDVVGADRRRPGRGPVADPGAVERAGVGDRHPPVGADVEQRVPPRHRVAGEVEDRPVAPDRPATGGQRSPRPGVEPADHRHLDRGIGPGGADGPARRCRRRRQPDRRPGADAGPVEPAVGRDGHAVAHQDGRRPDRRGRRRGRRRWRRGRATSTSSSWLAPPVTNTICMSGPSYPAVPASHPDASDRPASPSATRGRYPPLHGRSAGPVGRTGCPAPVLEGAAGVPTSTAARWPPR